MEKKRILVVGSANTDMVICGDHFPRPGETMIGRGFMTNQGGKGANQAVAAARLGGDTAFVCKLGDDAFGHATLRALRSEGVRVAEPCLTGDAPSGVAVITTVDSGENNIIIDPGANWRLTPDDIVARESLFAEAGIVLMQLETPVETITKAAELGKRHGALVILNPAPAPANPLPEKLLSNVDIIIPNEIEAASICGTTVTEENICDAMERLLATGVKDAVITFGSKGAYIRQEGKPRLVEAYKVKAVDTTAAGDTFCGALCVALCRGEGFADAIKFANKAASMSVTRRGAQMSMPRAAEIDAQAIT